MLHAKDLEVKQRKYHESIKKLEETLSFIDNKLQEHIYRSPVRCKFIELNLDCYSIDTNVLFDKLRNAGYMVTDVKPHSRLVESKFDISETKNNYITFRLTW